jgi:hypothetical protein
MCTTRSYTSGIGFHAGGAGRPFRRGRKRSARRRDHRTLNPRPGLFAKKNTPIVTQVENNIAQCCLVSCIKKGRLHEVSPPPWDQTKKSHLVKGKRNVTLNSKKSPDPAVFELFHVLRSPTVARSSLYISSCCLGR